MNRPAYHPTPKILILESQMIVASDVSLQLSKLGYDVIGIHTKSEDAFKTIQNNRPDIVLMNIEMQGKGSGIGTAKIISEIFQIPVVFLSAHTGRELFKHVIKAKPYAFIAKPFDKKDLKRGIETALDRKVGEELWQKNKIKNIQILKHPNYKITQYTNHE